MVVVRFSEFVGKSFGEIVEPQGRLAKGIAQAVCEVYNEFPNRWRNANNVISGFQRGFMKELCRDTPLPPPPQLPECQRAAQAWGTFRRAFRESDGLCGELGYWRSAMVTTEDNIGFPTPFSEDGLWKVRFLDGTVSNIAPAAKSIYDSEFFGSVPATLADIEYSENCSIGSSSFGGDNAVITKITYSQNVPNYCIDGGQYPDVVPPNSVTKNTTVNLGDDNSIDVEVVINTDDDDFFVFPTTVNVNGFSAEIGFGDINIGGGGGGGTGGGGGGGAGGGEPVPNPDDNEFFDMNPPPGVGEEEEVEEVAVEDPAVVWVLIEITKFPVGGKTILQNDPENNDYFAGYFSWVVSNGVDYWLTQQPIRKRYQAFLAPENSTGYRAYAVNGAKLKIRQFTPRNTGE